jgi:hypothetical protein
MEHTDKASALRQWLYEGAALYLIRRVGEGRLTMDRAAELLDVSIHELYRLAENHRIEVGASDEQRKRSREQRGKLVEELSKTSRTKRAG